MSQSVCVFVCLSVYMRVCVCVCVYVFVYYYICVSAYMCACVRVYVFVCMCILYVFVCVYYYICVSAYMYACVRVYVFVCMCIHAWQYTIVTPCYIFFVMSALWELQIPQQQYYNTSNNQHGVEQKETSSKWKITLKNNCINRNTHACFSSGLNTFWCPIVLQNQERKGSTASSSNIQSKVLALRSSVLG